MQIKTKAWENGMHAIYSRDKVVHKGLIYKRRRSSVFSAAKEKQYTQSTIRIHKHLKFIYIMIA